MPVAFVDESKRSNNELQLYILTAFIAIDDATEIEEYRTSLRAHLPPEAEKFHWYGSVDAARTAVIDTVSQLEVLFCVVARNMSEGEGDERARKKCLERLAVELESFDVFEAQLESRQSALDHRDRSHLERLRRNKAPGSLLRIGHTEGRSEPLLWVADVVAGAFGDYAMYNERRWRDAIEPKLYAVFATH